MKTAWLKLIAAVAIYLTVAHGNVNAQCPNGSDITSNTHCFATFWDTVPTPLPTSILYNNKNYTYRSGAGTSASPAVYQGSGGNGACNSGEIPFSGTFEVDGETCNYINGELQGPSGGPGGPLPVSLISFNAIQRNAEIELTWRTSFELNNREFRVERLVQPSIDGWSIIDVVPGKGNYDDFTTYTARDQAPLAGRNQYRLVQVDLDGSETRSGIVSVVFQGEAQSLQLFPNPTKSRVEILGISDGIAELYSTSGALISSQSLDQSQELDVSALNAGVYVVRVLSQGTVFTQKLIVN